VGPTGAASESAAGAGAGPTGSAPGVSVEPTGMDGSGSEQSTAERTVVLPADVDLHARPAAQFVRTAMGFSARVIVGAGGRDADAKSLLSVLALGAKGGTPLRLRADGDDAPCAVDALAGCVAGLVD
jgi:phosphotransferase system HPr (HPr) family protein